MTTILFFSFLFVLAALFALAEIQIEGPQGWAANLPTWRVKNRWTRLLYGANRPVRGVPPSKPLQLGLPERLHAKANPIDTGGAEPFHAVA